MAFDFEQGAMTLTIMILAANLMLMWGSTNLPTPYTGIDTNTGLGYLTGSDSWDYNAQNIALDINSLRPEANNDANDFVSVFTAPLTQPFAFVQTAIAGFQAGAALVWNMLTGAQQALLLIATPLGGGVVELAWVVIAVISGIEVFGLLFIFIRFVSLIRGGGGV